MIAEPVPIRSVAWSEPERRAWTWPERQKPSEWVEQHVHIPDNAQNPEPGPFSFDRTPYWREVIDLAIDPVVREIWGYKANQVGWTLLMEALIAYWAVQDPGACGVLMPDEDSVEELFDEELLPLIKASPAVNELRGAKWDETAHEIRLKSMPIIGIYAGSAAKLEKRKFRYAVGDEINLYRDLPNQGSALSKLLIRTTNWGHRGKAFFGSKPTTPDGAITKGYESCPDKRRYFMPCARCGKYQEWLWSGVKGFREAPGSDKFEKANWIRLNKPAVYECQNCKKTTSEAERGAAVAAGRWVSGVTEGDQKHWHAVQTVTEDGKLVGDRPVSERVGIYCWGIVSPWLSMSQLAAEFVEAEGDVEKTRVFHTARRALPWEDVQRTVRPSVVRDKIKIAPKPHGGIVKCPAWAVAIYATFDTQDDFFAGTIRAWGWGYRSQLLWHGECQSFDQVYRIGRESRFELEGEEGTIVSPQALLIDSGGHRTDEVYDFSLRDPWSLDGGHLIGIVPTKGMSQAKVKRFYDSDVGNGVRLMLIDTAHFKGALWHLIHDPDPTKWMVHAEVSEQYCLEMASEHLVRRKGKMVWEEIGTVRNEAWDCEVLQRAAAEIDNIGIQDGPAPTETPQALPPVQPQRHGAGFVQGFRNQY